MSDKDPGLALLPQLTSRWKIIANVSYDNESLHTDVKGLGIGRLHSSGVEISVWESLWIQKHSVREFQPHSPVPTPECAVRLCFCSRFHSSLT